MVKNYISITNKTVALLEEQKPERVLLMNFSNYSYYAIPINIHKSVFHAKNK